jgi:hypothetical protein
MATLSAQAIPVTGFTPSFAAAAGGGDAANPNPRQFLRVKNASGGAITLTLIDPGLSRTGQANPDPAINIPSTTGDVLIYLPPEIADPATGLISWTYSGVTSLTVALLTL